ncbi:hypothetical protein IWQ61_000982 [Dispira simplex]|nr:hypothetical protein IWQ61_000982 [Dispira simplex]
MMGGVATCELAKELDSETYVDVDRVRELCRDGVPPEIRGQVWKYLLGVELADRSSEACLERAGEEEYADIEKHNSEYSRKIQKDTARYLQRKPHRALSKESAPVFEAVINAYLNRNGGVSYNPGLVALCAPLVVTFRRESDIFFCFERIVNLLNDYMLDHPIHTRVAEFLTLFRRTLPDLFNYFQEEEVDMNEWPSSWLLFLLSRELPLDNTIRLWDYYFTHASMVRFHTFVCLAILKLYQPNLEDLEQSEIRTVLCRLPGIDVDKALATATSIEHQVLNQERLDL